MGSRPSFAFPGAAEGRRRNRVEKGVQAQARATVILPVRFLPGDGWHEDLFMFRIPNIRETDLAVGVMS